MRMNYETKSGQFVRNLGKKIGAKSQTKFYLGSDEGAAMVRAGRLVQVHDRIGKDGWDDTGLLIAKAVAAGKNVVEVPGEVRELNRYQCLQGIITVGIIGGEGKVAALRQQVQTMFASHADSAEAAARRVGAYPLGPSLAELVEAHRDQLRRLTDKSGWKEVQAVQCETLLRLIPDCRLGELDRSAMELFADQLANDEILAKGTNRNLSIITRKKLFEAFRRVLRKAEDNGAEVRKGVLNVPITFPNDNGHSELPMWSLDEMRKLYESASPFVRSMILLALNCGWQAADLGDFCDGHIIKDGSRTLIKMRRKKVKKGGWGVHLLWPETVEAIEWLQDRRDTICKELGIKTDRLYISERGKILTDVTSGGNKADRILNLWRHCLKMARRKDSTIKDLPFKWWRKQSQHYLRELVSDEVVSMHARRSNVSPDTLMGVYTNTPWKKVWDGTEALREKLATVFGG